MMYKSWINSVFLYQNSRLKNNECIHLTFFVKFDNTTNKTHITIKNEQTNSTTW